MLFPTLDFGLFFLAVFSLSWMLRGAAEGRKWLLVGCSYFFYGFWDWRFVPLLLASTLVSYGAGRAIGRSDDPRRRRAWMIAAVVVQLALLGYFKYAEFFLDSLGDLLHGLGIERDLPVLKVILPVGISFFTFQGVAYVVDVYRRDFPACESLVDFMLYKSFFPQLVAGPIIRPAEFLPQLRARPDPLAIQAGRGFLLILLGLFKKSIVANYLAVELVDLVFDNPSAYGAADVLLATYGYAIQIYCDFSAYSDMAIGLAALLGFQFPRNFDQPYRAESLQDFWRRWHMTLSAWLRDYLYIPLGGSRLGRWRTYRNLLLTMVLGGIWHGASWTFAIWGALHGTGLAVERMVRGSRPPARRNWLGRVLAVVVTFHVVCLAWIFFRAGTLDNALAMLAALGQVGQPAQAVTGFLAALIALGFAAHFVPSGALARLEGWFLQLRPVEKGLFVGMVMVLIEAMGMEGVAPFIYFQF